MMAYPTQGSIYLLIQECIPVGCVPAARRPYAWVCFPGGGGRGCLLPGGGCLPGLGGSALGGVCLVRGVSALGGVCLIWGGVSQHALRQTPSPPVDRILDTRLWKYYLGPTSLRPVTIIYKWLYPRVQNIVNTVIVQLLKLFPSFQQYVLLLIKRRKWEKMRRPVYKTENCPCTVILLDGLRQTSQNWWSPDFLPGELLCNGQSPRGDR